MRTFGQILMEGRELKINVNWSITDGKLNRNVGRIIIYDELAIKSEGPSQDHCGLIAAFSARYRISKSEVMSNAYRYYWQWEDYREEVTVCPLRREDERYASSNEFRNIINKLFK